MANPAGNTRNGKRKKTLKGDSGKLPIEITRYRHGSFEPQLIPNHQIRWSSFDDKILSRSRKRANSRAASTRLRRVPVISVMASSSETSTCFAREIATVS